jgi:signal transduction histidine kinase
LTRALYSLPLVTTTEKRPYKKALTQQLQAEQIENARHMADLLLDIGLYQDIEPFLPLLKDPNLDWMLQMAYNLTRLRSNNRTTLTAVERASKVVFALKNYSRSNIGGEKEVLQVNDGIKTVLELYQNQLKRGIEVIQDYQPLPEVWGYPDELIQVWTNLIHNAIQAMEGQGTLKLITRIQDQAILVEVTDSGSGMSPEIQARIFEPFFTTKPMGEGSGLGLHICQKIIAKHNGKLEVVSQPGQTTFQVLLPLDRASDSRVQVPVVIAATH